MTLRCLSFFALVLGVAAPASARAEPPAQPGRLFGTDDDPRPDLRPRPQIVMRLHYTRAPGAEACPDEHGFENAVRLRVRRWEPFAPNGPWPLVVHLSRNGYGYVGSIELYDQAGEVLLKRSYPSTPSCQDLAADLARTLAFKIEPAPPPETSLPQPPPPSGQAEPPRSPEIQPRPAPPKLLGLRVGMATWMDLATAPRPAFGVSLDVGVRVAWFSIAAEARFDPPAGATVGEGVDVSTSRVLGALVPCGHFEWFAGCLLAELGQIRGSIDVAGVTPSSRNGPYGAGGVRLKAEIPVVRHLLASVSADLTGSPPTLFHLDGQRQWQTPAFSGGLGVGLIATF
jgi:hypothetical protein